VTVRCQGVGRTIDQAGEKRSSAIESLRALAALAVLEGHAFGASRAYGAGAHASFLDRVLLGGGFSVYLFFALTGYLLYRPFARRDFGSGERVVLGRYAANRVFRILPLYYVVLIVYIVVVDSGGTWTTWWRSVLFLENFFPATLSRVDGVMWSLVVEVQFYALLPLLAFALGKLASGSARTGAVLLLGAGTAGELVRLTTVTTAVPVDTRWEYSLPATFVFFVPGMLLALVETRWSSLAPRLRGWASHGSAWFVASLPLWLVVMWGYNLDVLLVPATVLMVGGIALPLRRGWVHRLMEWRPLATLGVASYSIYLWHFFLLGRLEAASWAPHGYLGLLALGGVVSCGVALVSYRFIEAPFLRLRQSWTSAPSPATSSPVPELGLA
jgi:peptidoglycan/LPS O-acetylase OafA/YrhL